MTFRSDLKRLKREFAREHAEVTSGCTTDDLRRNRSLVRGAFGTWSIVPASVAAAHVQASVGVEHASGSREAMEAALRLMRVE